MANLRRFFCDNETGEILPYDINEETGEQLLSIPSVQSTSQDMKTRNAIKFPYNFINKTKKLQVLKANILAGSNTISHTMLLFLPTCMIFPSIICVIFIFIEVFLHVRCHKKNKTLKDDSVYYRSPFHVVTCAFCGLCRDNYMVTKIGHLQDKRRCHYDYLRGIAI